MHPRTCRNTAYCVNSGKDVCFDDNRVECHSALRPSLGIDADIGKGKGRGTGVGLRVRPCKGLGTDIGVGEWVQIQVLDVGIRSCV